MPGGNEQLASWQIATIEMAMTRPKQRRILLMALVSNQVARSC